MPSRTIYLTEESIEILSDLAEAQNTRISKVIDYLVFHYGYNMVSLWQDISKFYKFPSMEGVRDLKTKYNIDVEIKQRSPMGMNLVVTSTGDRVYKKKWIKFDLPSDKNLPKKN